MKVNVKTTLISILIISLLPLLTRGQLVINEFMPKNETSIMDIDGDHSDWIEIYNSGSTEIDLSGFHLSDDSSNLGKWTFPSNIILPNAFVLVFASEKNIVSTYELHSNFKISSSGEHLILSDSSFLVVDSIGPISLSENQSYGCISDGSTMNVIFDLATPNQSNAESLAVFCSHQSGFYTKGFDVTLISSDSESDIRYTLNGSLPSANSSIYSGPLNISDVSTDPYTISSIPLTPLSGPWQLDEYIWQQPISVYKTNVLRFASFNQDSLLSKVYSKTFFVDPKIKTRYSFPVISMITDSLNLFDHDTGIYVPGATYDENGFNDWFPNGNYHNTGEEWERPCHFEFINIDGKVGFESDVGIRIRGWASAVNPQKSFNVYFRSEYGKNKINYRLFEGSNVDTYKRFILRNSGQDFIKTHFRDAFIQNLFIPYGLELQRVQPSVVFLNGEYWGVYNIREKYDWTYFKYHFGIEKEDLIIVGPCGSLEHGTTSDYYELAYFFENNDLSKNSNYTYVQSKLDIENFIDFQIAEIWSANYDWPCNNYKLWKTNETDSKWRALMYDLDLSMGMDFHGPFDAPSLIHATTNGHEWPTCGCASLFFRKLLENNTFKHAFINRFIFHLNYTFAPHAIEAKIDSFRNVYTPEMPEHIARYSHPKSMTDWEEEVNSLRIFAKSRRCFMKNHIMDFFGLPSLNVDCTPVKLEDETIIIWPNPSNGVSIRISNPFSSSDIVTYSIYSMHGKLVQAGVIPENGLSISLPNVKSGVYTVRLEKDDSSYSSKLMILK
ncbi:MAG: hypothetical protein ACI97X_001348 [Oceanospirillaceae bacterium]